MGRLITFVVGVLVGMALKWQYDQQPASLTPVPTTTVPTTTGPTTTGPTTTGPTTSPKQRAAADIQEIAITVAESNSSATRSTPTSSSENRATPPDAG